ncbi:MAG: hypothetical protein AB1641_20425 [Thermodesulfobacteriota bacterium]
MPEYTEDIFAALTYQVKEEVINNYFRERRILEEEINEFNRNLAAYRTLEAETRAVRDDLACLLVSPDNFRRFFHLLGFHRPPLQRWGHGRRIIGRPPEAPEGLTARGFTRQGRYVNLTLRTYRRLYDQAKEGRIAAERLFTLAREINEDIKRFQLNYDLLSIIGFLKNMDVALSEKTRFLGNNFSAAELTAAQDGLDFKKLNPRLLGVRAWPEIPPADEAAGLTTDFLREVFKREKCCILPALAIKHKRRV